MKSKISFLIQILCITIGMLILTEFFYQLCSVVGDSMSPTLNNGSILLIQKYHLQDNLQANDIIVIRHPIVKQTIIKRIIGLPGDTVQIIDGIVYVNNEPFKEACDFPAIENAGNAATPITLKDNEYFVLGDNRNNSIDSRFNEIDIINFSYIRGKVIHMFTLN